MVSKSTHFSKRVYQDTIATDGLFDNLYEKEIVSIVCRLLEQGLEPQRAFSSSNHKLSVTTPFAVKQSHEIKYSHLDIAGRPVVVLEKNNVVPDHNQNIQVYYKFSNINLLSEPLMLISGFFVLFITCIIYTRADFSISKSSVT
ncbi:dolichyl-diphosphooligosaccharide--protein glycosyltransferase subunit 1A-like [Raphanus sativus]|uniref:Dolichyl-diphosphooligosaccharide--protein glycosyltransferase subunit 1 n=1 Tax=Raphanus sativus TaxID=3726 RepID=A0A9W3DRK2_RAPSA|nr:dolichyl-diphosphooligosaccharide--protein glycosyltransferase subunit 1A-like [Raphanus sativus]